MGVGIILLPTPIRYLGHEGIKRFCNRPDGFEELILKNLNDIKREDIFIHLGDICFYNESNWHYLLMNSVKAERKWLIKGNHDKRNYGWYYYHGWSLVCESLHIDFYNHDILFSHKPFKDGNFTINIHGHFHNNPLDKWEDELKKIYNKNHYLVAIENTEYKPLNLINIITEFNKKTMAYENKQT